MPALAASETAFGAIACPVRRRLLDSIARGERTVGELVAVARVSQPSVSEHLRILREAGLVRVRREGRYRYYRIRARPLEEVLAWVRSYERFWTRRLAALGRVLDEEEGGKR